MSLGALLLLHRLSLFVAVQYSTVEIFSDLCICFTVGEQWAT